jgi:hypothetical protein
MIVSWIHERTGLHEVDTETADLAALRTAKRALDGIFNLYYLIWRGGGGEHVCAERTARELEAVKAAIKAREPASLSSKPRKVTTPNIAA